MGFPYSSVGKESTCNAGDPGLIPGSGRSTGEEIVYPLQYSGLEIPWTVKSMGSKRVGHERTPFTHSLTHSFRGYPLSAHIRSLIFI